MTNSFIDKISGYGPLSRDDEQLLEDACHHSRTLPAGHNLVREGDVPRSLFVVLEDWACRYKMLPDGGRQIIAFLMPGDFCDIHAGVFAEMDHSIATLTRARVATIPRAQVEALIDARPNLAKAFRWTQLVDEGVLRATIVSMGRRTTLERVAHLLCELCFRMRNIGLTGDGPCEMPFSQIVLADAVGLTPVHTNRVVKKLRGAGALDMRPGTIIVSDLARLAKIAGFDANYLHRRLNPSG